MSPDDRDPVADALALARQAGAEAEHIARAPEPKDFAEVLRRAAALDVEVSPQDLQEAEQLAARSDAEIAAALSFGTLEDFLDDAAEFVAMQRVDEIPPMRALGEAEPPRRRAWRIGVAVAAALLLCTLGAAWLGRASWLADRSPDGPTTDYSAVDRARARAADGAVRTSERSRRAKTPVTESPVNEPEAAAPVDVEAFDSKAPLVEDEPDAESDAESNASKGAKTSRPSRTQRLEALDAEARAAWRAGDLGEAQRLFEALVRAAGRRSLADIAYGDLFSLARQRGDDSTLRRYWSRYAKVFPRGRYIDDARAGLCRTAPPDRRRGCWQAYLRDRPQGTYHQHARDVVARSE